MPFQSIWPFYCVWIRGENWGQKMMNRVMRSYFIVKSFVHFVHTAAVETLMAHKEIN